MISNRKPYILITGATGAIGGEIARGLCREGKPLILAARNEQKGDKLIGRLCAEFPDNEVRMLKLDLADDKSIVEAVAVLKDIPLEGIINNAGVMNRHFKTIGTTNQEQTVGVNFINTRKFTELLLPNIVKGGVVVFTTSLTRHLPQTTISTDIAEKDYSQLGTYGLSKRMLTTYAAELRDRYPAEILRVNCADPGVVDSGMISMDRWFDPLANVIFRPFIRAPRHGAIPALRAYNAKSTGHIFCRWAIHRLKKLD